MFTRTNLLQCDSLRTLIVYTLKYSTRKRAEIKLTILNTFSNYGFFIEAFTMSQS